MSENEDIEEERQAMARYLDRLQDAKKGTLFRSVLILIGIVSMIFTRGIEPHLLVIFCIAYEAACYIRVEEMLGSCLIADSRKVKLRRFFKVGNILRVVFIIAASMLIANIEGGEMAVAFLFLSLIYYEIEYSKKVREQLAIYKP
jgi:hypothetical protein